MSAWTPEGIQQRIAALPDQALFARRAELQERVRKRTTGSGCGELGHDDGADFELDAIGYEIRERLKS